MILATQHSALASAARTASTQSPDLPNHGFRGAHIVIDVTLLPGAAISNTVAIEGKDPISGKYYAILTSAALVGVGTLVLKVYPGMTAVANTVANDVVPGTFRINVTAGNSNSATYSVAVALIP